MKYTKQEVLQFVREEGVKFIRLAFCDLYGVQKNVSIMPGELDRAFQHGIAIDAWSVPGFGGGVRSDLILHPDPSTLAVLPWRPEHGRVVRMYCTITYPDGTPFERDSRSVLLRAVDAAQQAGYAFQFGTELEFYLFNRDEEGRATLVPYDQAGYMDIAPEDRGENIRREICITLEQMGIYPESSHHEEGPGQNEIDFHHADALTAADNAMTFRTVVSTIANRSGVYADFSPKPLPHQPGNGMHVHFSVSNARGDSLLETATAGVLKHIVPMTLFLNPVEQSYARLGGQKAPGHISWGVENRSQLVRLPATCGGEPRAERRSPDPTANSYLVHALVIYAALDALNCDLPLPPAVEQNLYTAPREVLQKLESLPTSLEQAKRAAKDDPFLATCLPQAILEAYLNK